MAGTVSELKGCHTQAKSIDQLMERIKEATLAYLESEQDTWGTNLKFIGVQKIAV